MDAVRIDHVAPDGIFATYENVMLWSWRGPATQITCQRMRVQLVGHAKAHPLGAAALTVIGPGVAIPPDDIRKLMVKNRREAAQYAMRGGAIVYQGDGLRGAVVRSVVTGLMLLATDIYPQSVFGETGPALDWLQGKLGNRAPSKAGLARAIADLLAHPGMPGVG